MNRSAYLRLILITALVICCPSGTTGDPAPGSVVEGTILAPGSAEEGLVYDPESGNYTLTYKVRDGLYRVVYYPPTKIDPKVESSFWAKGFGVRYTYRITNGSKAQQPLSNIRMLMTKVDSSTVVNPDGWDETIAKGYKNPDPTKPDLLMAGWYSLEGIAPGETLDGFAYESGDLPGVGIIEMLGLAPITVHADGGPGDEVGEEFDKLRQRDFVSYRAPMPLIRASPLFTPPYAASTLTNVKDHFQQLLAMELVEPVFADQLTKTLDAAIDALKLDDRDSARSHLEQCRVMIDEAQHADDKATLEAPINKLAARVLRFDSDYVKNRL